MIITYLKFKKPRKKKWDCWKKISFLKIAHKQMNLHNNYKIIHSLNLLHSLQLKNIIIFVSKSKFMLKNAIIDIMSKPLQWIE